MKVSLITEFAKILLNPNRHIIQRLLFLFHETLVTIFYGHADSLIEFQIPNTLTKRISANLNINDEKKPEEPFDSFLTSEMIISGELSSELIIPFHSLSIDLTRELHAEVRSSLKNHIKSPFFIVNTRSWITKPNTKDYGPTRKHKDGFWPGHLKVMVYLSPLDIEHGSICIGDKVFTNKEIGTCISFLNSHVPHKAIAGTSRDRISLEITLFRSFLNLEQFHKGYFEGRHYNSLFKPYFTGNKKIE